MTGPLVAGTAAELRDRLHDLIDGQGNRHFVLDLSETTTIDRAGVSVLVDALKQVQRNAGDLVLSGPGAHVVAALAAAGVGEAFAITPAWSHPVHGFGCDKARPAGGRRIG